ncbi:MAG TPA: N-acetylmuramoyl-L-alanine amidase [Clostridium sp.]
MTMISYDEGHGCGNDRGANGFLNEEKVIREYVPYTIAELRRYGHTCVDCTPSGNMTLGQSLAYRVNKSDACKAELHICFHANAFRTTNNAMGAEIEVASDKSAKYGQSVLNEIVKLGFKNRGIKRPSLYVTNHTNAVCILIEPLFIDSSSDCKLFNAQKLGLAIAKGIINIIGGKVPVVAPVVISKPVAVVTKGEIFRVITGSFSDESNCDARIKELKDKGFDSFKEIIK